MTWWRKLALLGNKYLARTSTGAPYGAIDVDYAALSQESRDWIESIIDDQVEEIEDHRSWGSMPDVSELPRLVNGPFDEECLQKAEAIIEHALTDRADFWFVYMWKAIVLQKRGRATEAGQCLEEGLRVCKHKYHLYETAGALWRDERDYKKAIKYWILALLSALKINGKPPIEACVWLAGVAELYGYPKLEQQLRERVGWLVLNDQGKVKLSRAVHRHEFTTDENLAFHYLFQQVSQRLE
jgi:tetratricopeptide (TPR) repeat protein